MQVWCVSNVLLLIWAIGFTTGYFTDGIAGVALVGMYGFYTVTNIWGLLK